VYSVGFGKVRRKWKGEEKRRKKRDGR